MSMILKENWPDIIRPELFKYFDEQYSEVEKMVSYLYSIQTSNLYQEVLSSAGEYPDLTTFSGTVDYQTMYEGYDKTLVPVEKSGGLQIRDTLIKDAQGAGHPFAFSERPKSMARAVSRTREKYGAEVFNDAFTEEPSDSDGSELCASDHARPKDSSTQSNEGTTAFGATGVEAMRLAMRKFTDDQGDFCNAEMDTLVVPEDLHEQAWEIINSTGKVNTANNNKNFHEGRYKLSVWLRMSDQTNYFGMDSTLAKSMLFWFNREPVKFFKDESSDTLSAKYIAYYRASRGWANWRFIYGMLVSG